MSKTAQEREYENELREKYDNKISIVAIESLLSGFVLADKINKFFNFSLQRGVNFDESYECYYFQSIQHKITLLLISNLSFDGNKIMEKSMKTTNYFLVIIGRDHKIISKKFLETLQIFPISPKYTASKNSRFEIIPSKIEGVNMQHTQAIYPLQENQKSITNKFLLNCMTYDDKLPLEIIC